MGGSGGNSEGAAGVTDEMTCPAGIPLLGVRMTLRRTAGSAAEPTRIKLKREPFSKDASATSGFAGASLATTNS